MRDGKLPRVRLTFDRRQEPCALTRPHGSVRGAPGNRRPYRDWGQSSRHRRSNVHTPTPNACSTFRRRTVSPSDPTDFDTSLEGGYRQHSCRVGGWRVNGRVRWRYRRFRTGPQSGSHGHVSSPRSPNRPCGFPATGSPVGSCVSHTEHLGEHGPQGHRDLRYSSEVARLPLCVAPRVRSVLKPVHALTTPSLMVTFGSFTFACDGSGISGPNPGR